MFIDKTAFMLAVGGLVAGGAGGYFAGDRHLLNPAPVGGVAELQSPSRPIVDAVASSALAVPAAPPAPVCDDTTGTVGDCPAPGYSADEGEGSCGVLATKRCQDFKQTMKPRVAASAVACLNALNPGQRCDAGRVNLCAHLALMNACLEPEPTVAAGATGTAGAAPTDELTVRCTSLVQGCGGTSLTPPMRECRATLSGMSAFGRDQMASCMKAHCADKGLVGCEAVIAPK